MAVVKRLRCLLREKKGMQYYNASYMCRRVVRSIEISGIYDETEAGDLISSMSNSDMEDIDIQVDAVYYSGNKIQLRQTFSVTLTGSYRITILTLGENPITVDLPIRVKVAGMSEVYWRS